MDSPILGNPEAVTGCEEKSKWARKISREKSREREEESLGPEEVGHAPNCIMGQLYNMLHFTRSLML